jgi:hypothetical protein
MVQVQPLEDIRYIQQQMQIADYEEICASYRSIGY